MHPFVLAELKAAFDLDEALMQGTLPVIWTAPSRWEALSPMRNSTSERRSGPKPWCGTCRALSASFRSRRSSMLKR